MLHYYTACGGSNLQMWRNPGYGGPTVSYTRINAPILQGSTALNWKNYLSLGKIQSNSTYTISFFYSILTWDNVFHNIYKPSPSKAPLLGLPLVLVTYLLQYPSCNHCHCHYLLAGNRYKILEWECYCYLMECTRKEKQRLVKDKNKRNFHIH